MPDLFTIPELASKVQADVDTATLPQSCPGLSSNHARTGISAGQTESRRSDSNR